ncbi:hypothetical protein C4J81_17150 [Deltaproteobacteria bacterium Smac51]|nr:hypothetical protein C4J81_17150 [Deltaproteobacteria bacterium Smac51]
MPLVGVKFPTLGDVAKRTDPNGKIDVIVEMLTQTNEILEDMPFIEGNLPTGHKTIVRTGLPTASWRKLNYGVPQSKSMTQPVIDTCGMLEAYAEIDKDLADLNGNTAAFRLSEDRAFLEAMNQQMAETLFYGDTAKHPERFLGLSPRYSTLNKNRAKTAENIIDAGGTAANALTSAFLVCWGEQTAHGIYPKGSKAGFQHTDKGQVTLEDAEGGKYEGYRTHYKWDIGLTVRDWRYIVRLANIDLKTVTDEDLIEYMVAAVETLPDQKMGRPVFYMNRQLRTRLRNAFRRGTNVNLSLGEVGGKHVISFDEIPVKRCDSLVNTEARVIA